MFPRYDRLQESSIIISDSSAFSFSSFCLNSADMGDIKLALKNKKHTHKTFWGSKNKTFCLVMAKA